MLGFHDELAESVGERIDAANAERVFDHRAPEGIVTDPSCHEHNSSQPLDIASPEPPQKKFSGE